MLCLQNSNHLFELAEESVPTILPMSVISIGALKHTNTKWRDKNIILRNYKTLLIIFKYTGELKNNVTS